MVTLKDDTFKKLFDQFGVSKGEFKLIVERIGKIEDSLSKLSDKVSNHETRTTVMESAKETSHKESGLFWLKLGVVASILIGTAGILLTVVLKLLLE